MVKSINSIKSNNIKDNNINSSNIPSSKSNSIFDVNGDGIISGYEKMIREKSEVETTKNGVRIKVDALIINLEGDIDNFKLDLSKGAPYDYVITNTKTNTKIRFDDALIGDEQIKYGNFLIKYDEKSSTEVISIDNYLKGNAPLDDGLTINVGQVKNSEINIKDSSIRKIDTTNAANADIKLFNCTGDGIFLFNGKISCNKKEDIKLLEKCSNINIEYKN